MTKKTFNELCKEKYGPAIVSDMEKEKKLVDEMNAWADAHALKKQIKEQEERIERAQRSVANNEIRLPSSKEIMEYANGKIGDHMMDAWRYAAHGLQNMPGYPDIIIIPPPWWRRLWNWIRGNKLIPGVRKIEYRPGWKEKLKCFLWRGHNWKFLHTVWIDELIEDGAPVCGNGQIGQSTWQCIYCHKTKVT